MSTPAAPWFHCAECAEAAKDCQHDHSTSADGVTWLCQGCGKPMEATTDAK